MRRALLALFLASLGIGMLGGCSTQPSTKLAPDVKEPDNRNVSGEEILRRKLAADGKR